MNRQRSAGWLVGVALMMFAVPLRAAESDEVKLQKEHTQLDKEASATDAQKTSTLAKQFNVPEATVQDLRGKGQGWGEVTIGLAQAQQLTKMDPKTYPTLSDALTKIESMRAAGAGWGKIAKDLGFKLGPVISSAQHARHDMHATGHSEKMEQGTHSEHPEHAAHPEHPQHPDHPDHPDRPGH